MNGTHIVFDDLVRCVIEGEATEEELQDLAAMMRNNSELQDRYCQQMYIHALLSCHKGQEWPKEDGDAIQCLCSETHAQEEAEAGKRPRSRGRGWVSPGNGWKIAAVMAVVLSGAAVWFVAQHAARRMCDETGVKGSAAFSFPTVRLVAQKNVRGLDLPETLPGMMRQESGETVLQLRTGVEMTIIGPSSLNIRSGMQVVLESGQMLANVPHWATGFTVYANNLEIYDLGTVFCVQADRHSADVFVLKGRVQVNETLQEWGEELCGEDVGLCEAGEGVRALAGEAPMKFASDWPAAKELLGTVAGRSVTTNTAFAMKIAKQIENLWVERYMPAENVGATNTLSAHALAFRKTAWVRPVKSLSPCARKECSLVDLLSEGASGTTSEPVQVESSSYGDDRRWSTVFTNEVPLRWDWPLSATSAKLEIVGMNSAAMTNFTPETSFYVWRPFAGRVPSAEDIYTLDLTFYNRDKEAVGLLSARLAVLTGSFGQTVVDLRSANQAAVFTKRSAIIPYDASWTAATVGASGSVLSVKTSRKVMQTNRFSGTSGYYGYKLNDFGSGAFEWTLSFPEVEGAWDAKVSWSLGGMIMSLR